MEVGSRGIEQALLNNELDVGVLLQPFDEQTFNSIELCNYPLMVLLRRDATWATRKNKSRRATTPIILMFPENFSLNSIILNACKQHGFYPTIACRTSQWHLLADMVLQRMGIALLPQYYTDMLDRLYLQQCHSKTKYSMALSHGLEKIFLFHQQYKLGLALSVNIFSTLSPNVEIA